jgi:hypothetical protein
MKKLLLTISKTKEYLNSIKINKISAKVIKYVIQMMNKFRKKDKLIMRIIYVYKILQFKMKINKSYKF